MLVESLVAVTLLAAALGGSTALLVQALRLEGEATVRSTAVRDAASLADVLRRLTRADGAPLQAVADPTAPVACPLAPHDCAVEAAAGRRIAEWQAATLAGLPAGSLAQVDISNVSPPQYLVTITWPGSEAGAPSRLQLVVEP